LSKWLGHSSFVLTLTTYADYIREDELAVPKVGHGVADLAVNVTQLRAKSQTAEPAPPGRSFTPPADLPSSCLGV
jgi:hypothetical protein